MKLHTENPAGVMSSEESRGGSSEDGCAVWLGLCDGLVDGIHHSLNNRMAALAGVAQVLETELPPGHPLGGVMTDETRQMESTVALLRTLVRGRDGPAPIQPADALADAKRLFAVHHSLRDLRLEIETDPGVLPLWVEPSRITHALVILVAAAGRRARQGQRTVRVSCAGDERAVAFTVLAEGGLPDEGEEDDRLREVDPAAAGTMLREFGGVLSIQEEAEGIRLELRLPTLLTAQRD
jgi:hypothetical protein